MGLWTASSVAWRRWTHTKMDRTENLVYLPVGEIAQTPDSINSRVRYHETALEELTESVREHGVLQPVLVRPVQPAEAEDLALSIKHEGWPPKYVLVAGNRRLAAAKRAGCETIPALIRVTSRDDAFVLNIVENVQRENLSGSERVRAITLLASLREEGGEAMSTRRIAALVKKDHTTISKWLGINRQPLLREAVADGKLRIGHAMKLAAAPAEALPELVKTAPSLSQPELQERVAELRSAPTAAAQRVASANEKRALTALRSLSRIEYVAPTDDPTRAVLDQILARARDLVGPASSC